MNAPMLLYYNCARPDLVLAARRILPSRVHQGVSFSEWSELGSHGPFKLTLCGLTGRFRQVKYGAQHKPLMFADEREWVSGEAVTFDLRNVQVVTYMENAPCCLGPIVLKRVQAAMRSLYPALYSARRVNDPYLNKETA